MVFLDCTYFDCELEFIQRERLDSTAWRGVGRIMKVGFQPVNISAQFYGNAIYREHHMGLATADCLPVPKLSAKEKMLLMEEKLKELQAEQPSKK